MTTWDDIQRRNWEYLKRFAEAQRDGRDAYGRTFGESEQGRYFYGQPFRRQGKAHAQETAARVAGAVDYVKGSDGIWRMPK